MQNVDLAELAKFSDLADSWWDENGMCRPLHDLNPCRGEFIATHTMLQNAKVLDVGCGGGILSEYLAGAGAHVTGIDANGDLIAVAKLHAQKNNQKINYIKSTVEELADGPGESYDVITCLELLEHVPDPFALVRSCARRLKDDGSLFLSTINRTAKAYALGVIGAEYILRLLPRGTHDYGRFIKPSELAAWGRETDLETLQVSGMAYNPLTRHAKLRRDPSVNFIAHLKPRA